jgi:hypothetical protein
LLASSQVVGRARVAWLNAAQAWLDIKTDAYGDIAPAAAEAVDLALWTGRLAYTDPDWTPTVGPDHAARSPQELAPEPENIRDVLAAVHQATMTLTTIAAGDYNQIRTAGLTGRLLVPIAKPVSSPQADRPFVRAPRHHLNALLNAYRDAGTASAKATSKIAETVAEVRALDRRKDSSRVAALASRDGGLVGERDGLAEIVDGSRATKQKMVGPIEGVMRELGVTDRALLRRGLALDEATSQLVVEAAQQTAPQRWNVAVSHLNACHDTAQIIRHVLAQDGASAVAARSSAPNRPRHQPHFRREARQAEP